MGRIVDKDFLIRENILDLFEQAYNQNKELYIAELQKDSDFFDELKNPILVDEEPEFSKNEYDSDENKYAWHLWFAVEKDRLVMVQGRYDNDGEYSQYAEKAEEILVRGYHDKRIAEKLAERAQELEKELEKIRRNQGVIQFSGEWAHELQLGE